jgi:hypothetical protein
MPRLNRTRLAYSAAVAMALGLIVWGLNDGISGDRAIAKPLTIDRLVPNPGDIVLRQSQIGADLATGYRGQLVIDGQEIPTYDLVPNAAQCSPVTKGYSGNDTVFDPGEGTLYFTPGPGSTIEKFAPGPHRITVKYWKLCDDSSTALAFAWSFKVS